MTNRSAATHDALHTWSAADLVRGIRAREVSAVEVLEAHLRRIEEVNPSVNAIISLVPEQAMEQAKQADALAARGEWSGRLHGLPIAIKDTADVAGVRTTYGSLAFAEHVPARDAIHVERIRRAGAVIVGKTNVPEFGAGSHTFNRLFGTTYNPYDLSRSAGGSSGGAAAALAARMLPLADGSDMGGSLRNPASFCNVVGFRPSPGRVPAWANDAAWSPFVTAGPMARSVDDLAMLFEVMAGPDDRSPIALETEGRDLVRGLDRGVTGLRLAWSPDLGGAVPVEESVRSVLASALPTFESLGASIVEDSPDFSGADHVFQTVRAWLFHSKLSDGVARRPDLFKDTIRWNVKLGDTLTGSDLATAEQLHGQLFERMREFFTRYDALLLPVSQVPPFPAEIEFPTEVSGVAQPTYIDWMQSSHFITTTGCPSLSIPAGFTSDGLPIGLQIVGPHRADNLVLRIARAFEKATGFAAVSPPSAPTNDLYSVDPT